MRYVIYGAGSIGGTIGARLFDVGRDVMLICRGQHLEAVQRDGLTFKTPVETKQFRIPAVPHPGAIEFSPDDVVILGMKSQDTVAALDELRAAAGDAVPVVCTQNGVDAERMALRRFQYVYGTVIRFPAMQLGPGVIANYDAQGGGEIEVGRYPEGIDDRVRTFAADLTAAGFDGQAEPKIARWKYEKMVINVGSPFAGVFGLGADTVVIRAALEAEAWACFKAAGIDVATKEEAGPLGREPGFVFGEIEGEPPFASSLWQGIMRGLRSAETDYINGEVVLLGAMYGVPAPYNRTLNALANRCAHEGITPGTFTTEDFEQMVRGERSVWE